MKMRTTFLIILVLLCGLDAIVWRAIIFAKTPAAPEFYFLSVGQGDSEMVVLPGGVRVLIDGGGNNRVQQELAAVLPFGNRYLDLVVLSHPDPDHYVGLIEVFKDYQVGAFIFNGLWDSSGGPWPELLAAFKENNIKAVVSGAGDKIKYRQSVFEVLSPAPNSLNPKKENDSSLVLKLDTPWGRALFTGDIGANAEKDLLKKFDLKADVLKVSHHGSKYSSHSEFLAAVQPSMAVIEVGKNSYGHPTAETLARLAAIGAQVFRTDNDGTIKAVFSSEPGRLQVFRKK